ncbi:hypothetical protein [Pseudoalteromonas obscura]|uniref:Uncharacterized protein n=1 Tax=Pseudoalteromonas obscura TaxID=3048491 RepID=A0ABT7EJK7_9GAMM|nr:hypothetical protein [Pseudoalteromonas sp. P94(2023)]MDK2595237.1 hypothetical protein [Pseudoalteromonas sp. P94(2023)]
MSIALAHKALDDKVSVHMIYAAGSFPGKVREVIPSEISNNYLTAFCKVRGETRVFDLEKSVFIAPDEVEAYELAELPPRIDTLHQLAAMLNPYISKEHQLELQEQSLNLINIQDGALLIGLSFAALDKNGFKKQKPWQLVSGDNSYSHFSKFSNAANRFQDLFLDNYKAPVTYQFELDFMATMRANWKPRAIAGKNLICAPIKDGKGNQILTTSHWAYHVKYGHREALKIEYLERMENKKAVMRWVQGLFLSFKQGDLFESNSGETSIQVTYAMEMGWDTDTDSMYEGIVTFDFYTVSAKAKWLKGSSFSLTQMEFLELLITGKVEKKPLVTAP